MKPPKLDALHGKKIVNATLDVGNIGIMFEDGTRLTIHNTIEVKGSKALRATDLLERSIIKTKEMETSIDIVLDNNIIIKINMDNNAYTGPEAVQLHIPGEHTVVWR